MADSLKSQVIELFRDRMRFAILESILIVLSIIFFANELGYWVFSGFLAILSALFYIGVNLDYWTGKKQKDEDIRVYYELERIANEARNSMQSIKDMEKELDEIKESLNKIRN